MLLPAVIPDRIFPAMTSTHIQVCSTPEALAEEAARRVVAASERFIAEHGRFCIALSGGSTPRKLHELLLEDRFFNQIDFSKWHVFWGDERCVGPEDSQSNYRMAKETLLVDAPIPSTQIHRMKGEIEPEAAAKEYGQLLKAEFGDGGLDLLLLGMGDDGHTLSLFPHTAALHETEHRCVANYVEKLSVWRITMTALFANRSAQTMFLVAGAGKAPALHEVLEGDRNPEQYPSQLIQPAGELIWLMDVAAAGM